MNTPRGFGQLNSLFRSKHGVVYTYELDKRYRIGWRTGEGGGPREGLIWNHLYSECLRFGLTTADRFTWTLSRRYSWLCTVTLLATVTSSRSLALSSSSSFALDCWVTSTGGTWLSVSTFGRILLATRSLNKIHAHVCEKDWYIPDILRFYKMNTGSSTLSYF